LLVLLPLLGFAVTLLIPQKQEKLIARNTVLFIILHFLTLCVLGFFWVKNGFEVINLKEITLFKSVGYEFYIDFYFDEASFVYLFLGAFICFLISQYSRYYMHREEGYKRFFSTFLFFYSGLTIVVSAGNLETLFIGWEILGISSFLLIAFYRNRYLPVKNAVKVFSVYRIGDVGIILAMWLSHHLWHENISFIKLNNYEIVHEHLAQHSWIGVGISLLLLLSAMAKSAIFPFSSWLPRAMEGPTPSSAVFYGSLSVHIGAFLLLRTYHFWEHQVSMRVVVIIFGLLTAILATLSARVQSNIKSQIAYSSLAQIGLIFIEIALGLEILALVHIAGNAFLRTYQLLISPSTVTYKIREQFFHFQPREKTIEDSWPKRLEYTLYILSLKEWNLDNMQYKYLWNPAKQLGSKLSFLSKPFFIGLAVLIFLSGLVLHFFEDKVPVNVIRNIPLLFAAIGLLFVLKSFTERKNVFLSWWLIVFNHCWIALAVSYNEHFGFTHHIWYLGGVLVAGFFGFWILMRLKKKERKVSLDQFYGYSYEYKRYNIAFLLAGLVLAGFPISPTFIGEDLVFSHIHEDQFLLAFCVSLSLIIDGLALIRIYSRVFLGPFIKTYDGIVKRNA
jgi:NADH:ubiquinone oxidoreductase subunit 5 (subunit L)/multisubunit Na+/H+ antiporter MnhA subunit